MLLDFVRRRGGEIKRKGECVVKIRTESGATTQEKRTKQRVNESNEGPGTSNAEAGLDIQALDSHSNRSPAARRLLGLVRTSFGWASAKHDTPREDGGLSAIVRRDVGFSGVDEDPGVLGLFAARGAAVLG